jgi:hypothetical protein
MRGPILTLLLPAALLPAAAGRAAPADPLERALVRQAPKVIAYCQEKGYRTVGVLKFQVADEGGPARDDAGTFNALLAGRLEVALVLADDPRRPVGVIRDASAVAAHTPGANHLTAAGRRALFAARFPLAWGGREVEADALVSGVARVAADLRTVRVALTVYARGGEPHALADLTAATGPGLLGELGESFALRGAFDGGRVDERPARPEEAAERAARVKRGEAAPPLASAPVKLEVRYDGRAAPLEARDGGLWVAEPAEGQKVTLVLTRDGSGERYGAVLKVNGEGTLGRQRLPDLLCRKWVLEPGDGPGAVRGYQIDGEEAKEFSVTSRSRSAEREVYYGPDVGTITLTVFRERRGRPEPPDLSDEGASIEALGPARLPERAPESFAALKAQLLDEGTRGLIEDGRVIGQRVKAVRFTPDPVPLMSVTVRYYKPSR